MTAGKDEQLEGSRKSGTSVKDAVLAVGFAILMGLLFMESEGYFDRSSNKNEEAQVTEE